MVEPKTLSLVGHPANQVGFRVVRSDSGEEVATPVRRVRRTRSESRNAFLFVEFPAGTPREEVDEAAALYGITNYEVDVAEDRTVLRRADSPEYTGDRMSVNLGGGRKVVMARTDTPSKEAGTGLQLISIEFDKAVFRTDEDVAAYLSDKSIDITTGAVENTDTHCIFTRSGVAAEGAQGKIEIDSGVVVSVVRADVPDLPQSISVVVNEAAYGSWGWGQLDFAAALADVEFSRLMEEAIYRFKDVVYNILFYSSTPLAQRKELIYRASAQFAIYAGNLIDGLPPGVVVITRSDMVQHKESSMSQQQTQNPPQAATAAPAQEAILTRADVQQIVSESVTAAVTSAVAAALDAQASIQSQQRADEVAATAAAVAAPATQPDQMETLIRSIGALNDNVSKMAERLSTVENTTVVRSDAGNAPAAKAAGKVDVFSGLLTKNLK
jgi:uncharacterized protein (DUF1697 family)